jgi:ATP-binding cassette subfamily C (CFTR/MRP) protein 1
VRIARESYVFYQQKLGAKGSQALTGIVFEKIMRLSNATNKQHSKGDLITFIQVDSEKLNSLFQSLPNASRLPFQIIICLVYLYLFVGMTMMVAVAVIIFFGVVNFFIAKCIASHQMERMKFMGMRTNAVSELVENIKLIKFYSWTEKFTKKANDARNVEVKKLITRLSLRVLSLMVNTISYPITAMAIFISASLWFNIKVSVPSAIALLQVLSKLKSTTQELPDFIGQAIEFLVSITRIQDFLLIDEIEKEQIIYHGNTPESNYSISIDNCNFYWGFDKPELKKKGKKGGRKAIAESRQESLGGSVVSQRSLVINDSSDNFSRESLLSTDTEYFDDDIQPNTTKLINKVTLKNLNIQVAHGEFVAIIGEVGSGKTSIINSIIGDTLYVDNNTLERYKDEDVLEIKKGSDKNKIIEQNQKIFTKFESDRKTNLATEDYKIRIEGSMSLVQQAPWILNDTVRNNILLGNTLDEEKYNETIEICQLSIDLDILEGGDLTQIGEKGINLSGGQKARLSIARAVYAERDIVLMDDPLSALDAHVRKKIFDQV